MKVVDYGIVAARNLRRQAVRSALTIIALAVSTAVLVAMAALGIGSSQAVREQFGNDEALSIVTVTPNRSSGSLGLFGGVQQVNPSAAKLDDATVVKLITIPHVLRASARAHLWEIASLRVKDKDKDYVASAEGLPSDAYLPLAAGRMFGSNESTGQVVIGYAYAEQLGYTPEEIIGKTITLTSQKGYRGGGAAIPGPYATKAEYDAFNTVATTLSAKVIGVTTQGLNQNSLFVPLDWAHAIRTARYYESGRVTSKDQLAEDGYTSIQIKADAPSAVSAVTARVADLGYGQSSLLSQVKRAEQFMVMMWLVLGSVAMIALLAAVLGVVNTMLMAVTEQRYEIGVWRASGARRGLVVRLFLAEAAILGVIGGALGIGIASGAVRVLNQYGSVLLSQQGLTAASIATVSPALIVGALTMTVLSCMAAALYPAIRAARADPSIALSAGQ